MVTNSIGSMTQDQMIASTRSTAQGDNVRQM